MEVYSGSFYTFEAQFVIWGAGKLGRVLVDLLGKERIIAFIDNDLTRVGTSCNNIPIIDYETYKKGLIQYPIIISARDAENEILRFLEQEGIEWAFPLSTNINPITGFLRQAPVEHIIGLCEKEVFYVYGYNPLSMLIYDYLIGKGFLAKILLPSDTGDLLREYCRKKKNIIDDIPCNLQGNVQILLATKMNRQDVVFFRQLPIRILYNLDEQDLYYNPQIAKFRNFHNGERCFIIGTGPSLTARDLNVLLKNKEICFSVNGIFKIFENTKWRPDYYLLSDASGMITWKKEILEMDVKDKFIADVAWNLKEDEVAANIYKWHLQRKWVEGKEPEFTEDFARKSFWGKTIVYEGALQLAVYMGFSEIYLLGTDCCQYDGEKQHFVSNYSIEKSILHIDDMFLAYQSAKKYADAHGIKIFNATRGGDLEIFERVDFDKLF
jgi:hypothetical protein